MHVELPRGLLLVPDYGCLVGHDKNVVVIVDGAKAKGEVFLLLFEGYQDILVREVVLIDADLPLESLEIAREYFGVDFAELQLVRVLGVLLVILGHERANGHQVIQVGHNSLLVAVLVEDVLGLVKLGLTHMLSPGHQISFCNLVHVPHEVWISLHLIE